MSGKGLPLFACILLCALFAIQGEDVALKSSGTAKDKIKSNLIGEVPRYKGNGSKPESKETLNEVKSLQFDGNTLGESPKSLNFYNNLTKMGRFEGNGTSLKISFNLGETNPDGTLASAENDPPTDGKVTVYKLDTDLGKGHLLIGNLTAKDPLDPNVAKGNFTSFTLVNNLPSQKENTLCNNMESIPAVMRTEGTTADITVGNDKDINNSSLKYSTLVKTISSPHMQAAKKVNILSRNMRLRPKLGGGENYNPFVNMKMGNRNRDHHEQFLSRHHHSSKHSHPHKRILMDTKEEIMLKPFDLKPHRESHVIDMNIVLKNPKMHFSSGSPFGDSNMHNNPLGMPPLMDMFNYANMLLQDMEPHNVPQMPVGFGSQEVTYVFRNPQQKLAQSKLESLLRHNPFASETPFLLNNNEHQQAQSFDFMSPIVPDINCPIHGIPHGLHRHMLGICTCDNHYVK